MQDRPGCFYPGLFLLGLDGSVEKGEGWSKNQRICGNLHIEKKTKLVYNDK